MVEEQLSHVAFAGDSVVAEGSLPAVLTAIKRRFDAGDGPDVLCFEAQTGRQVDFDLQGSLDDVLARSVPPTRVGPGRPRLGVVAREVSLLPRHWEWLEQQPNGASAALRRLVDEARGRDPAFAKARTAKEACHRFMTAMAGNRPGYEEAIRSLYAGDEARFEGQIAAWPESVTRQVRRLATDAFSGATSAGAA